MSKGAAVENCIDIIRPFRDELDRAGLLADVQFMGGIGSAALISEASLILPDEGMIVAPRSIPAEQKERRQQAGHGRARPQHQSRCHK